MAKWLHEKLEQQARRMGLIKDSDDDYTYGTMAKIEKREKRKKKKKK